MMGMGVAPMIGGEAEDQARQMYGIGASRESMGSEAGSKKMSGRIRTARHVADMPASGGGPGVTAGFVYPDKDIPPPPLKDVSRSTPLCTH